MDELVKAIILLTVGIAVLLCGMHFMSGGLKKIAGRGIRQFFRKSQNNPVVGMGIGAAVTTVIQSSDATAALVIGFINAGAMTMFQGLSIILGAYIGTTITGVIASFSSVNFSTYFFILAFIGTLMMMLFHNEKVKSVGEILCGFGLLFFGLSVMKDSFANADINAFCTSMFTSINVPILLFLVGILMAALAQSSSAITGIAIAMVGAGALPLASAFYIVLGATVGTVANTLLSSMHGNIDGKRTAVIAFAMRLLTAVIAMVIVIFIEPYLAEWLHNAAIGGSDQFPLALFTVIYNVIFMPLLIPLIKPFIKLFSKIIKEKPKAELEGTIQFIDDKLLSQPDIALMQVGKEIVHMFELAYENYKLGLGKVLVYDRSKDKEIVLTEDKIDYLNQRITDFMIKLAPSLQNRGERKVGAYFHVINDIERIGDHAYNFYETADAMNNEELSFSPAAKVEIRELNQVIIEMFDIAKEVFVTKDIDSLAVLRDHEERCHRLKQNFYANHYERVLKDECSQKMTPYISTLIVELERVADHLTNIGYSIVSPTGDLDAPLPAKPHKKRAKKK